MKQLLYFKTVVGHVEEKAGGDVKISGYASTKDVDRGNDKVLPSAFEESIKNNAATSGIAMLLGHDQNKVIGGWDVLSTDARGLIAEGTVRYDTDECKQKIKNGDLRGMSIGYIVEAYQVENKDGVVVYRNDTGLEAGHDWEELWADGAVRVITKLNLVEISIVSTPMNEYSFISSVKHFWATEVKMLKTLGGIKVEAKEGEDNAGEDGKGTVEAAGTETKTTDDQAAGQPAGDGWNGGQQTWSQENGGGENAGGNPAPVAVPAPAPISQESQAEALEKAKDDVKSALLEEVKPLLTEMLEEAVKGLQLSVTDQVKVFSETLAGINGKLEAHERAFKNIEVRPGVAHIPSAGIAVKWLTDAQVLRTLWQ